MTFVSNDQACVSAKKMIRIEEIWKKLRYYDPDSHKL